MEEYNHHRIRENTGSRGSFLYGAGQVLVAASTSSPSVFARTSSSGGGGGSNNLLNSSFHLPSISTTHECYEQSENPQNPIVKTESAGAGGSSHQNHKFHFGHQETVQDHHHQLQQQHQDHSTESSTEAEAIKAKIIAHPQYSNLLEAYMDCQKVGAPPEVVARLTAARQEFEARQRGFSAAGRDVNNKDPELDQFMEAYYDMLVKYREELTRPLQEAMEFMRRVETQLNMLGNGPIRIFNSDEKCDGVGSSEEDQDNSGGEAELPEIDPRAEDRELKNHLLRKYSGYLSSLKQELSKKKKKGKLPKDARQKLLNWWELHYKWPYPSESEKVALAESTGLDQKQINNWFINQRKRHWKPSEDMQFMVMDGLHAQNTALYMEGHYVGEGPYRLGP